MKRNMLKSEKGVSLIEILIAIILFSVGISFAMRTLPSSNVTTSRARNITKASNLSQEKLESLMTLDYAAADLAAGTHNDPDNPIDNNFFRAWTVVDDSPLAEMKRVSVTVRFETASNDSSVTLSSFISSKR